jgi:hypothetical protein
MPVVSIPVVWPSWTWVGVVCPEYLSPFRDRQPESALPSSFSNQSPLIRREGPFRGRHPGLPCAYECSVEIRWCWIPSDVTVGSANWWFLFSIAMVNERGYLPVALRRFLPCGPLSLLGRFLLPN